MLSTTVHVSIESINEGKESKDQKFLFFFWYSEISVSETLYGLSYTENNQIDSNV